MDDALYTVKNAAEQIGCNTCDIYNRIKKGVITPAKMPYKNQYGAESMRYMLRSAEIERLKNDIIASKTAYMEKEKARAEKREAEKEEQERQREELERKAQEKAAVERTALELEKEEYREWLYAEDEWSEEGSVKENLKSVIDSFGAEKPISSGILSLDDALDGGFREGLYIIGGLPGAGKTALAMQIADHIAQNGADVLVISQEMTVRELVARSISREMEKYNSNALTAIDILSGYGERAEGRREFEAYKKAVAEYGEYAGRLFIKEGGYNTGVEEIKELAAARHYSMIIVDYLQVLKPWNPSMVDKTNVDRSVAGLKELARDRKVPVLATSSLNRGGYYGAARMDALKESGNIEYSCDDLFIIQPAGSNNAKNKYEAAEIQEEANKKDTIEVKLAHLKHRFHSGESPTLMFDKKHCLFEEESVPTPFVSRHNGWEKVTI